MKNFGIRLRYHHKCYVYYKREKAADPEKENTSPYTAIDDSKQIKILFQPPMNKIAIE